MVLFLPNQCYDVDINTIWHTCGSILLKCCIYIVIRTLKRPHCVKNSCKGHVWHFVNVMAMFDTLDSKVASPSGHIQISCFLSTINQVHPTFYLYKKFKRLFSDILDRCRYFIFVHYIKFTYVTYLFVWHKGLVHDLAIFNMDYLVMDLKGHMGSCPLCHEKAHPKWDCVVENKGTFWDVYVRTPWKNGLLHLLSSIIEKDLFSWLF